MAVFNGQRHSIQILLCPGSTQNTTLDRPSGKYSKTASEGGQDIGRRNCHDLRLSKLLENRPSDQLHRIALAFEVLTTRQVCAAFSKGVGRPVRYRQGPIKIEVSVPNGYREQLDGIQTLFGTFNAPYFGPDLSAPEEALALWEGHRGVEEYAREVFPVEEAANGQTWMN